MYILVPKSHKTMKKLSVTIALCLLLVILTTSCKKKQRTFPNVIIIYADDLGKGMISAYGQKHIETPHIDRLIEQGVSFSNAYSCTYSAPSRASFFTGYHDCHNDKWSISAGGKFLNITNSEDAKIIENQLDSVDVILPENDLYLAEVFQNAGYVTAQIGKLGYGFTTTHKQMERQGWDYYFGYLDHQRCHGFYPPFLWENKNYITIEGNTHKNCGKSVEYETAETFAERWNMEGKKQYSQNLFLDKTLKFIQENKEMPFFLLHATQLPHGPVSIPEIHPSIKDNSNLTEIEKEYASMVLMLDEHIGKIIEEVKIQGIEENTMIIFASDNGHEIYYTQENRIVKPPKNWQTEQTFDNFNNKYYSDLAGDVFNGNASMAGLKWTNLQGGINVPLTICFPSKIEQRIENDVVAIYDLLPTFADILNVDLERKKDGISLKNLIFNRKKLDNNRIIRISSSTGETIIRNDGYKLRFYSPEYAYELFYLPNDFNEKNNLILEKPEIFEELKACQKD